MRAFVVLLLSSIMVFGQATVTNYVTDPNGRPFNSTVTFTPTISQWLYGTTNVMGVPRRTQCVRGVWGMTNILPGYYNVGQGFGTNTLILVPPTNAVIAFGYCAQLATNMIPSWYWTINSYSSNFTYQYFVTNGSVGASVNLNNMAEVLRRIEAKNGATPVSLISFGDSVSSVFQCPQQVLFETLAQKYGMQAASHWAGWYNPSYWKVFTNGVQDTTCNPAIDAGGTAWPGYLFGMTNNANLSIVFSNYTSFGVYTNYLINGVEFFYVTGPNCGKWQILTNGVVSKEINAFAASDGVASTNYVFVDNTIPRWSLAISNATGANLVSPPIIKTSLNPTRDALRVFYGGQGGIGLDTFVGIGSNNLYNAFKLMNPDLFAVQFKHGSATTRANLDALIGPLTNACPNVVPLFFGVPATPQEDDTVANATIQAFCVEKGYMYADLASQCPPTNQLVIGVTLVDSLHPSRTLYEMALRPYLSYWGMPEVSDARGQRFDKVFINKPLSTTVDENTPLSIGSRNSGGSVDFWFPPGDTYNIIKFNGDSSEIVADTAFMRFCSPGTGGGYGGILFYQNIYNGSQLQAGMFTPGRGFYVGTAFPKTTAAGYIEAQNGFIGPNFNGIYNVTMPEYGADPTGVADSRVAISAAINAALQANGGTVYFPPGTYLCNSMQTSNEFANHDCFIFDLSNYTPTKPLKFLGYGATLKTTATATTNYSHATKVNLFYFPERGNRLSFEGLRFLHSHTGQTAARTIALYLGDNGMQTNAVIQNCTFDNWSGHAIYLSKINGVMIQGNTFSWDNGFDDGFDDGNPGSPTPTAWNSLGGPVAIRIAQRDCYDVKIVGNWCYGSRRSTFAGATEGRFIDGFINGNPTGCLVEGNYIYGSQVEGIYLDYRGGSTAPNATNYPAYSIIKNNTVVTPILPSQTWRPLVGIRAADSRTIVENNVVDGFLTGIFCASSIYPTDYRDGCIIQGNYVREMSWTDGCCFYNDVNTTRGIEASYIIGANISGNTVVIPDRKDQQGAAANYDNYGIYTYAIDRGYVGENVIQCSIDPTNAVGYPNNYSKLFGLVMRGTHVNFSMGKNVIKNMDYGVAYQTTNWTRTVEFSYTPQSTFFCRTNLVYFDAFPTMPTNGVSPLLNTTVDAYDGTITNTITIIDGMATGVARK